MHINTASIDVYGMNVDRYGMFRMMNRAVEDSLIAEKPV